MIIIIFFTIIFILLLLLLEIDFKIYLAALIAIAAIAIKIYPF